MAEGKWYSGKSGIIASAIAGNSVNNLVYGALMGIVLVPISQDFGWPRAYISGVAAIAGPLMLGMPLLLGALADRFAVRPIVLFGNVAFTLSLLLASRAPDNLPIFYALFLLATITGSICSPQLFNKVLAGWFDAGRGTAMGTVAGIGNGLGHVAFPIIAALLVTYFGWRGAYQGAAIIVFLAGFPLMFLFLRDPPKSTRSTDVIVIGVESTDGMTLRQALVHVTYWKLLVAGVVGAGCMLAIVSHTIPVLTDRGISLAEAVPVLTVMTTVGALAQMMVGWLLDKTSTPWVTAPLYASSILGIYILLHGSGMAMLMLGGLFMGVGVGTEFAVLPLLLSRYFGVRHFGVISGVSYACIGLAANGLPYFMDSLFDIQGSYDNAFRLCQVGLAIGAVFLALLPRFGPRPAVVEVPPARADAEPLIPARR